MKALQILQGRVHEKHSYHKIEHALSWQAIGEQKQEYQKFDGY